MVLRTSAKPRAHAGAGVPWRRPSSHARVPSSFGPSCVFEKTGPVIYGSYVDELLAILPASGVVGDRKFVHSNHLYSVAALTDNTGAVVERYRYDAYGQRIVLAGDGVTLRWGSSYGNQVGFTGRYLDKETGLYYFRARYYSGSLGRFVSRNNYLQDVAPHFTADIDDDTDVEMTTDGYVDPLGVYVDGYGMYEGAFAVYQTTDASGQPIPALVWGGFWLGARIAAGVAARRAAAALAAEAAAAAATAARAAQLAAAMARANAARAAAAAAAATATHIRMCSGLYDAYKESQDNFNRLPCSQATTCEQVEAAIRHKVKELALRGAYIAADCDRHNWAAVLNRQPRPQPADHAGAYAQAIGTIANCWKRWKELGCCDK